MNESLSLSRLGNNSIATEIYTLTKTVEQLNNRRYFEYLKETLQMCVALWWSVRLLNFIVYVNTMYAVFFLSSHLQFMC